MVSLTGFTCFLLGLPLAVNLMSPFRIVNNSNLLFRIISLAHKVWEADIILGNLLLKGWQDSVQQQNYYFVLLCNGCSSLKLLPDPVLPPEPTGLCSSCVVECGDHRQLLGSHLCLGGQKFLLLRSVEQLHPVKIWFEHSCCSDGLSLSQSFTESKKILTGRSVCPTCNLFDCTQPHTVFQRSLQLYCWLQCTKMYYYQLVVVLY